MTATPPKPSQWISVKERLPENAREVLVSITSHHQLVGGDTTTTINMLAWYTKSEGWVADDGEMLGDCVSHWMPLPAPPAGLADETAPKPANPAKDAEKGGAN